MNKNPLTLQLKEHALSQGVDLIGITSVRPFIRKGKVETVIDPKELLEDAQAVIVTAFYMNEEVEVPSADKDNPKGRFTYAYSMRAFTPMEQYHINVIRTFLEQRGYKVVPNPNYRIPDKIAAVRAGLGKYGKNSVIVTGECGSYVMFVTLVTNAPLEYEEYEINTSDCGPCDICMKSCPTGAIEKPYQVNRERCITAWLWGTMIPRHFREKQENRIFGCGECVKVCPRNKNLVDRKEYPEKTEDTDTAPELIPLLDGSEDYCRKILGSFPLNAGVDAIRGNAIIALGNLGTEKAIDALLDTLAHPKTQIRTYSAWALGKIGGEKVETALKGALQREENREVREEIRYALGRQV